MPDKNKPIQKSLINFKNGLQNRRLFDILDKQHLCGSDSVVECHLAKVEVAGPNPVSRSNGVSGLTLVILETSLQKNAKTKRNRTWIA